MKQKMGGTEGPPNAVHLTIPLTPGRIGLLWRVGVISPLVANIDLNSLRWIMANLVFEMVR